MEDRNPLPEEMTTTQLERTLDEMESALTDRYCTLGKQLLEVAEREDKEISRLVDQIIALRRQLAVLQQPVVCPNCGGGNQIASLYCSHCGTKLQKEG